MLLIKNIKQLVGIQPSDTKKILGATLKNLHVLENAWMLIEDETIKNFGLMEKFPDLSEYNIQEIIDASGKLVLPTWCDSHTHIVFASSRENEFVMRIQGKTYEEIAAEGGGILNSAKKLAVTSEEVLIESALKRLHEVIKMGTGAIEIKSGYGLSYHAELKMLRVIQQLKKLCPITIKSTFLGAHAIPLEYKKNRDGYIKEITHKMLPVIAEEQLADYIDVFCDQGFFTPEETDIILSEGVKYGLKPKIHANELGFTGGIQKGVEYNAISVDHLEYTGQEEIKALKNSHTIATILPSTAFFLKLPYAPAREMINQNLCIALASDYNPGSSPSGNMSFVLSLACLYLQMLPEECIQAATINGAAAMEVSDSLGSITIGKKANFFITKNIPNYAYIPYSFGSNLVECVYIQGKKII